MKQSTALALVAVVISCLGVICVTAEGRRWLGEIAAEQVDGMLDSVALTPSHRRTLEELKRAAIAQVDAKFEQLRDVLRCAVPRRSHPREVTILALPALSRLPVWTAHPRSFDAWRSGACAGNGYLPAPRGALAMEWRSCRPSSPR